MKNMSKSPQAEILEKSNNTDPSSTKPMLTQKDRINLANKENHDWKEDYITIPQEPTLKKKRKKKSQGRNQKSKQITNKGNITGLNELIYCRSQTSLVIKLVFPRELKQKYKTWMGN